MFNLSERNAIIIAGLVGACLVITLTKSPEFSCGYIMLFLMLVPDRNTAADELEVMNKDVDWDNMEEE